jgi:hypothetical protein
VFSRARHPRSDTHVHIYVIATEAQAAKNSYTQQRKPRPSPSILTFESYLKKREKLQQEQHEKEQNGQQRDGGYNNDKVNNNDANKDADDAEGRQQDVTTSFPELPSPYSGTRAQLFALDISVCQC